MEIHDFEMLYENVDMWNYIIKIITVLSINKEAAALTIENR